MTNTALITGCSSGFGELMVHTFQRHGWNVAATLRSPEKAKGFSELENVEVIQLDVTDKSSVDAAVTATIERFGAIDVLVNNAGVGSYALFEQENADSIRDLYETNVFGVMNVMHAVLPGMRERESGRVINITSMAGVVGIPVSSVYCSSKHAVEGITEALALEYKDLNIQFKTVAPGAYPSTAFGANLARAFDQGEESLREHATKILTHFTKAVVEKSTNQDPQEVANLIFDCATQETPVRSPVGADAVELNRIIESANSHHEVVETLAERYLPASA